MSQGEDAETPQTRERREVVHTDTRGEVEQLEGPQFAERRQSYQAAAGVWWEGRMPTRPYVGETLQPAREDAKRPKNPRTTRARANERRQVHGKQQIAELQLGQRRRGGHPAQVGDGSAVETDAVKGDGRRERGVVRGKKRNRRERTARAADERRLAQRASGT